MKRITNIPAAVGDGIVAGVMADTMAGRLQLLHSLLWQNEWDDETQEYRMVSTGLTLSASAQIRFLQTGALE